MPFGRVMALGIRKFYTIHSFEFGILNIVATGGIRVASTHLDATFNIVDCNILAHYIFYYEIKFRTQFFVFYIFKF